MPSYQTTGLVLGRTDFGEADRVIRFLTAEHGKLSAVAKGVRRAKSKSGGHLEPFGEVDLMLTTGRNLDIVTSARLVWYPHQLTADYQRLGLASIVAVLIDRLAPAGQAQPELYEHTRQTLGLIDAGHHGTPMELWFKLRLLTITGLRPALEHCLVCGRSDTQAGYWFEPERGGITCDDCRSAIARPMSVDTIKLWRLACDYPYAMIDRVSGAPGLASASLPDCDDFYDAHAGRSVRSSQIGAIS